MKTAYILQSVRTAGGRANKGGLKDVRPDDLAAIAIKEAVQRAGFDPGLVDDVIMGCAFPEGEQGMNMARIASLKAGLPVHVPAQTVNRFCSSGLQTIATAATMIMSGQADCIVAGGAESMSMIPMGGAKFSANPDLAGSWPETYASMGITAELVADKYGINREDQDAFAMESHKRAAAAQTDEKFAGEIVPVPVESSTFNGKKIVKKAGVFDADDGIRADTSMEGLGKLKPAFRMNGSVTAGNTSQMTDGAAATIVVSEEFLKAHNLEPVARYVGFAVRGVAPEIMGIGPVEAIPYVLEKTGLTLADIGLIELNEAFAAQSLAVIRELGLDTGKTNVNGGAIALGHPLGCTGAKLTATLLAEMKRRNERYGMVSMCIGGGMGATGIFELNT